MQYCEATEKKDHETNTRVRIQEQERNLVFPTQRKVESVD